MGEASLRDRRQALLDRSDLGGTAFCRTYSDEADAWLSLLADRATDSHRRGLALLAVGGYGRGELSPFSDLDVVLVHGGRKDVAQVADAIWYPVWDQGVRLDHSVRLPSEVLAAARGDLRVALGLLDARMVWGDAKVAQPLLARTLDLWRSRLGATWLPALAQQMEARHHTQGDVAFLLEPDLKESHGGLRDVNVLRAIAVYAPALADYVDLASLVPASTVLTAVRVELHRSAGRELDRLLLQEQDHIAEVLSYPDADALMAAVSEAGREIAWLSDDAWRRRRFWQPEPALPRRALAPGRGLRLRRRQPSPDVLDGDLPVPAKLQFSPGEVEPGVAIVGGEVLLTPAADVEGDSSIALRLAAVAAERGLPIARSALHRLAEAMATPPDPWPPETRQALVRVLSTGQPAVEALESLDHEGLLVRILSEWEAVRNKPQRNAYHRFTVDRHLLEAAANAAALVDRVDRPDLLLVASLLHDIGKGYPGDHTEAGVVLIDTIARRMGFPPSDVATLVTLCRHHLLLAETATRRDLDDPATVETVTQAVGDRRTLELLGALTEADSLATGPSAWGSWKAGLVAELVARTGRHLGGDYPATTPWLTGSEWVADVHHRMVEEVRNGERLVVLLEPPRVMVTAPDRPGLLASVAGTLALHGLDVRSADATSEDGVATEVFAVEVGRGSWPDGTRLREDLDAVLSDRLALDERLAAKAAAYAGRQRPTAAHPVIPEVAVDNTASVTSTVVEIQATDELGLLHRVTRALFDCDLDVVSARVSTVGDAVVDAFYVRDASGAKVTDPGVLELVKRTLRAAIT